MQEIAGEAAVYVDPFAPTEIAAQIVRLWQDGDARAVLRRRGIARAAQFSWAKTAQGMLRALEEAAA
jgi:glycosyltransferase involved in cell wall biosynthesis